MFVVALLGNASRMVRNLVMTRNIRGYSHLNTRRCLLKIHVFVERANARTVRTVQNSRERPSERGSSGPGGRADLAPIFDQH